jgi:tRNA G18 (ribose-2'-O)-methylase SpoU
MSKPRLRTTPDLALTSPTHQEAIKAGTEHFYSWTYNVEDRFKSKTTEEIRATLKANAFPYAVLVENILGDFNFSTVVRNANAFGAREVFYTGDKRFDRRGCQGTHNYTDIHWLPTIDDLMNLKDRYSFAGIDNIDGAHPIRQHRFVRDTLLVFGSEGVGLTPMMRSLCDTIVMIPQYGSVRSINVGCASAIVLEAITNQMENDRCLIS